MLIRLLLVVKSSVKRDPLPQQASSWLPWTLLIRLISSCGISQPGKLVPSRRELFIITLASGMDLVRLTLAQTLRALPC